MNRFISIAIGVMMLTSCELIVIGSKKAPPIEINQNSALGAIYLFKTELDSNNVPAATQILADPKGNVYLAFEKYEMYDEIARIGRIISHKPITSVKTDSLTATSYRINMEFDYIKAISFTTAKIQNNWYIVDYTESYH